MADVAFVPERDVLERGEGVAPHDAGESAQAFGGDRVALVRHGRTAFLAGTEKLLHFQHFGPLQMSQLRGPAIDARSDQRERRGKFRVPIALDDLGGKFRGLQPELCANVTLDPRIEMRVCADGAAQFADADALQCLRQPFLGPAEFVEHERELQPESDRLRVNAVAPANHRRHLVTPGLVADDAAQFADVFQQNPPRRGELHRQRRVENIRRRQALVDPARGRADGRPRRSQGTR